MSHRHGKSTRADQYFKKLRDDTVRDGGIFVEYERTFSSEPVMTRITFGRPKAVNLFFRDLNRFTVVKSLFWHPCVKRGGQ